MHRLPWAIDGTIGIDICSRLVILEFIIASTIQVNVFRWKILVGSGRYEYIAIHILISCLTVLISGESGMHNTLVLARLGVIPSVGEHNLSPCHWLTCSGTYHYIAMAVVGQLLRHHCQIAHIEESAIWLHISIVRCHLHQVGAQWQTWNLHAICHFLIVRMTIEWDGVILLMQG